MDPVTLQLIAQLGASGVLMWMLIDMRKEAREQREYIQRLLTFLIEKDNPGISASQITRLPKIAADNRTDADV